MTDFIRLPAVERVATGWKNGGGTTSVIDAAPADAGLDSFAWRLSIAQVTEAGPFSNFPGIDRHLAVLEGRLELLIDGDDEALHITSHDDPLTFAGDSAVIGRPVEGPVRNLNLMVRRDCVRGRLWRPSVPDFVTAAQMTILVARAPCLIHLDSTECVLAALDAVAIRESTRVRFAGHSLIAAEIGPSSTA